MPFPPAHLLVGAGVAEVARAATGDRIPRGRAWLAGALLGALPDVDVAIGMAMGRGGAFHGTATHSVAAVVVWTLLAFAVGGGRWAALAGAAYGSHLVLDLLDERGRSNLHLGWPFTAARADAVGEIFPKVVIGGNGLTGAPENLLRARPLENLLLQTILAALVLVVLLGIAWLIRRLRASSADSMASRAPRPESS